MEKKIDINRISEEELDALMADVLAGDYTQEEYDLLSAWIAADPAHAEEFNQVKSFWNADVSDHFVVDTNKELNKLMKRVQNSDKKRPVVFMKNLWIASALAASLLIGAVLGWSLSSEEPAVLEQYTCMTGKSISTFNLPDGTTVHLNKDSRLEYDETFGQEERKVRLEGEAYFDVTRMEDCSFIVDLDGASITVKGTSFDAFNNGTTGIKGAALVSGSVDFQTESQYLRLTPSRQVLYDVENNELTVSKFDPSLVTAWKDRLFRYKSLTIYELAEKLMEEYDMNIVFEEEFSGEEKYSGTLDVGLPPSSVLDLMSMQVGAFWTKRGDIYYISHEQ